MDVAMKLQHPPPFPKLEGVATGNGTKPMPIGFVEAKLKSILAKAMTDVSLADEGHVEI
jgi:hypothetical protein